MKEREREKEEGKGKTKFLSPFDGKEYRSRVDTTEILLRFSSNIKDAEAMEEEGEGNTHAPSLFSFNFFLCFTVLLSSGSNLIL